VGSEHTQPCPVLVAVSVIGRVESVRDFAALIAIFAAVRAVATFVERHTLQRFAVGAQRVDLLRQTGGPRQLHQRIASAQRTATAARLTARTRTAGLSLQIVAAEIALAIALEAVRRVHAQIGGALAARARTLLYHIAAIGGRPADAPASHAPVDERHGVFFGFTPSAGQAGPLPVHFSAASHSPQSSRQTVDDDLNLSAGQAPLRPSHFSASSHGPAEARHSVFFGDTCATQRNETQRKGEESGR
jgi:hypothetical protein